MRKKRTIGPLLALGLLLALTLAACGPSAAPPVPTRAPAPTFTPTPEGPPLPAEPAEVQPPAEQVVEEQAAAEPTPTDTPPPPPPPTPTPAAEVIINTNMNVRGGPGTNYNIIGAATAGERYPVTGRNDAGNWWQIDYRGQSGWVFNDLVTAQNTGSVAVAVNIPAPPPVAPAPQPQPQPQPQEPPPQEEQAPPPPPEPAYEFNRALLQRCDPNAGVTYVQGTTYRNGQPTNGLLVAFSYAVDGPIVATVQSGPHQGYEGWSTGFYSHIIQHDGPREGDWFFWIVDGNGQRISAAAHVHTDGTAGDGRCQQAVIDFDS
jgi:uncharacterized protein YraI